MSEQRNRSQVEAWDLEIACDTDRLRQQESMLKRTFPRLELLAKTRFFCVFGCTLPAPLTDAQKAYVEQLVEVKAIYRYRCGKQKEGR